MRWVLDRNGFMTVAIAVFLLLAWEIAGRSSQEVTFLLSRPSDVWTALITMARSGTLLPDVGATTAEALLGTVTGTLFGSALGLALWMSKSATRIAAPFVVIVANFPVFALAPAAIVWLGIGMGMKVFLGAFATFFVSLNLAHRGAKRAQDTFGSVFDGFRASPWDAYKKVVVPGALEAVFSSMRLNVGLGILGAFIGEFIASEKGLGREIMRASGLYQIDRVFAASVCIIIVAGTFDWLAKEIEHERLLIARFFGIPRKLRARSSEIAERS